MARLSEKIAQQAERLGSPAMGSALTLSLSRDVLTEIPLSQIRPDPDQPRKDLGNLAELSASIREMGVVQPIIVSVDGYEAYRIIAGERRFTAAQQAGLAFIPAIVRSVEEHQRLAVQLIENLHRKDLNPFEEAASYRRLLEEFDLRQEDLAKRLGKSQESVSEALRLLSLPPEVQREYPEAVQASGGRITRSLLIEIARQPATRQNPLWESAKRGDLTVKKARAARGASTKASVPTSPVRERTDNGYSHLIPLPGKGTVVTVTFAAPTTVPPRSEIIAALEQALELARAVSDIP